MARAEKRHGDGSDATDQMVRSLVSAPADDEPSTADEDVVAADALAAYRRREGVSGDQLRAELDLGD